MSVIFTIEPLGVFILQCLDDGAFIQNSFRAFLLVIAVLTLPDLLTRNQPQDCRATTDWCSCGKEEHWIRTPTTLWFF